MTGTDGLGIRGVRRLHDPDEASGPRGEACREHHAQSQPIPPAGRTTSSRESHEVIPKHCFPAFGAVWLLRLAARPGRVSALAIAIIPAPSMLAAAPATSRPA